MRNQKLDRSRDIIKAIDPYLPPSIRESSVLSLEELIRARVLICCLATSAFFTLFAGVLCTIFHLVTTHDFSWPIIIAFVAFCVVCFDGLFFYKTGKLDAAAILYSLSFFLMCVISVVITGGYDSPVKQILIVCPVLSFLISGRQEGIYNAALIYVVGLVLLLFHVFDFSLIQLMPEATMPYLSGLIWLITIVMVVVCLFIYDLLLEDKRDIRAKELE